MFLYTATWVLLWPLIATAIPTGKLDELAAYHNSGRALSSLLLALDPIPSPKLNVERRTESNAISDVVLEPRQAAVAGVIGAIVGGAVGSTVGAGGSSFPGGPDGSIYGSNNPSPLTGSTPALLECTATSSNGNLNTVQPANPFEVRKAAILTYPITTISMDITDHLNPLNSSLCFYNTSCSLQMGLQVAAPRNGSNSSFVTYTDLPRGNFIQCSSDAPHLGINFTAESDANGANTTFKVTLIHTVLYESKSSPEIRSASFVIDLNSAAGNASSLSMSRSSNMTVVQPNGTSTYAWRQAGDAWYSNATTSAAPAGWIGDAVVDAT